MLKQVGFGLIAGAMATAVMDASQSALIPAITSWVRSSPENGQSDQSASSTNAGQSESSPERVAHRFADMIGVSISRQRVETLGNRLHWAYGTQWGLPYALLPVDRGPLSGLLYGSLLWLGSDELLLWAIGIAGKPTDYPIATHLKALAAHAVYGLALGTTTRGLESAFSSNKGQV